MVIPGGGYQRVVIDKEGRDIGEWLNSFGVTAFVLKYRLPEEGHAAPSDVPLQDAQRAMRVLRNRAESFSFDPDRLGVIGFSAGGHLAGALAGFHGSEVYQAVDDADRHSARPDFLILGYPAIGSEFISADTLERYPGLRRLIARYPLENGLTDQSPPTFLFQAANDASVSAQGSIHLFTTLRAIGVGAEIHVFQTGGHGFGINYAQGPAATWPMLCREWMGELGFLTQPQHGTDQE